MLSIPRLRAAFAILIGVVAIVGSIGGTAAQRGPYNDRAPYGGGQRPNQHVAGQFDYYSLVLSWSPSYCAGLPRDGYDPQCHRRDGKRYSFILHGLWPQYEKGYPEFCFTRERPFVPQSTIDRMQDIMPSPKLTIHEYKKHGTCSGLSPDGYYDISRKLFAKVNIPRRFVDPQAPFFISTADVEKEFMTANPKLSRDMFAVVCGGPGNRLREVRVCFNRDGEFRACGSNENPARLCRSDRVYVPPVRPTAGDQSVTPSGRLAPGERRL